MNLDTDDIFQALRSLWRGGGATGRAIREQSVLMELTYVVDRAGNQLKLAQPSASVIAEECKRCIEQAISKLPTSRTQYDPDFALAARILLGLDAGLADTTFQARREILKKRLSMSETQLAHKRGGRFTFEEERLFDVAEHMWRNEFEHVTGKPDFKCGEYHAHLTVTSAEPRLMVIKRVLFLEATRDNAQRFEYTEIPHRVAILSMVEIEDSPDLVSYAQSNMGGRYYPTGPPINIFTSLRPRGRNEYFDMRFTSHYELDIANAREITLGLDTRDLDLSDMDDSPPARFSLCITLPFDVSSAEIEVKDYAGNPPEEDIQTIVIDNDGDYFFESNMIKPNTFYLLRVILTKSHIAV